MLFSVTHCVSVNDMYQVEMIEVELCSQLCRSNGLSDPYSQIIVSGEAVDWLQSGMPGLMRGQYCQKIRSSLPLPTAQGPLSLPNCRQAGSGSAESQPEVAVQEELVKVLPVGEEQAPDSFK